MIGITVRQAAIGNCNGFLDGAIFTGCCFGAVGFTGGIAVLVIVDKAVRCFVAVCGMAEGTGCGRKAGCLTADMCFFKCKIADRAGGAVRSVVKIGVAVEMHRCAPGHRRVAGSAKPKMGVGIVGGRSACGMRMLCHSIVPGKNAFVIAAVGTQERIPLGKQQEICGKRGGTLVCQGKMRVCKLSCAKIKVYRMRYINRE